MTDPQSIPPIVPPAGGPSWIPGTLSEWVIMSVVVAFLWMVKQQNDRILPALAEVTTTLRALPTAIADAVKSMIREKEHSER